MALVTKFVTPGDWRTLESFWNQTATVFFRSPARGRIRIFYGWWIFSIVRQRQDLDGLTIKRLSIGRWSVAAARVQVGSWEPMNWTYDVEAGDVAVLPPGIAF